MNMKVVYFFSLVFFLSVKSQADELRFSDTGEGIIIDNKTGLMWTRDANLGSFGFSEMNEFVSKYSLSGYIDWRLPEKEEVDVLISGLVDYNVAYIFFTPYGSCSYSPSYFAQNNSYFQYSFCSEPHVKPISLPPRQSALWLVRSGSSSVKRYTQEEVNVMIHDALQENGIEPIILDTGNCSETYTGENLESVREKTIEQCRNNPSSCGILATVEEQEIGTVGSDLGLHLPLLHYQTLFGVQEIWANLEYVGLERGAHHWRLQSFGIIEE